MLSTQFFKRRLPAILAAGIDFMSSVILLYSFASVLSILQLREPLQFSPLLPAEVVMSVILVVGLISIGSYKTDAASIGKLSMKRPSSLLAILYMASFVFLSLEEAWITMYPQFLLKLLIIVSLYALMMTFGRFLIHLTLTYILRLGWIHHKVLLVFHKLPDTPYFKEILRYIEVNNLILAGYCSSHKAENTTYTEMPYLGEFIQTPEIVKRENIDEVIILNHSQKTKKIEQILSEINTEEVLVRLAPGTLESIGGGFNTLDLTQIPVLAIRPRTPSWWFKTIKRLFDIFTSLLGLLIATLLFPIIAWRIKRTSPGPVFYRQERLGKNKKPFILYKFRTMFTNSEDEGPQLVAKGQDDRITPVGHFLRKSHLDEIPQFWNVLKGNMAIVGPRPERAYFARQLEKTTPYYSLITKTKPGLTSLGMVKYGYAHDLKEMSERILYDLIYVNQQSLIADFKIIVDTAIYIIKKILFKTCPIENKKLANPPAGSTSYSNNEIFKITH
ncbi:exopolysaccharide biosynthesis polyprenyl glycosylphosphotransferase [Geofilum rubicundum]|uniref:Undecaprenyl-phosphate galactosephosphotransferase n=1 Tax=Geofilum rubicundum JCM 15548 TaxID=1236989 RepID=A0A0E9LV96_9BACT|nr:exopolysaccharide biosynthesis polyprenyl glycosylphosphotransferase [Geofilum rubicundum]GAO29492.1 undecaprenyl-phosphate galactosephosphotransferase [Geofilum rubicundum JCM 15548]